MNGCIRSPPLPPRPFPLSARSSSSPAARDLWPQIGIRSRGNGCHARAGFTQPRGAANDRRRAFHAAIVDVADVLDPAVMRTDHRQVAHFGGLEAIAVVVEDWRVQQVSRIDPWISVMLNLSSWS